MKTLFVPSSLENPSFLRAFVSSSKQPMFVLSMTNLAPLKGTVFWKLLSSIAWMSFDISKAALLFMLFLHILWVCSCCFPSRWTPFFSRELCLVQRLGHFPWDTQLHGSSWKELKIGFWDHLRFSILPQAVAYLVEGLCSYKTPC